MSKMILCGIVLFAAAGLAFADGDAGIKPIGFVIDSQVDESADVDAPRAYLTVLRDGREVQAFVGDEVYPGDTLKSGAATDLTVAFVDQSAVRMHPDTQIMLNAAPSTLGLPGATVVQGHASVAFQGNSAQPRSLSLGVGERAAPVLATTPAKLDILVTKDTAGNFLTTVAVLKGIAVLTPKGTSQTDLAAGGQAIMTISTPVAGVAAGGPAVSISQGNLGKDQIAALHTAAVTETLVSTSSKGAAIKSTVKSSDGTITVVTETLVNGVVIKDSSVTIDSSKKKIDTWSESGSKISFTRTFEGFTIKSSNGKATVKGSDKSSYTGTTTVDPKTGVITFTTSKPAKDGSTVSYTFNPSAPGGAEQTLIKTVGNVSTEFIVDFNKTTGVKTTTMSTGTIVNGVYVANPGTTTTTTQQLDKNPPSQRTPDGHGVDQDSPPKSQ